MKTNTKTRRAVRLLGLLLTVVTVLSLLGVATISAGAADGVSYVDCTWDEACGTLTSETKYVTEYTEVNADTTAWTAGRYVVSGEVTVAARITVTGDVHLILTDGCTLTAQKGITVTGTDSLTIYGQAEGSGKLDATGETDCAGIGGGNKGNGGNITVNGGNVTANGGDDGAGIGGGYKGNGGSITVNGGNVTANGGIYGAGIGGGREADGGNITINGGTVTATGNILNHVDGSAGIGGGYEADGGIITINGGNITANGGYEGAGIGGGEAASGGTIIINGGEITANSGSDNSAGIGGGRTGSDGNITISGGTVTATTFSGGAAIGGGREADGGNITINGGTVTVKYDESNTNVSFGAGIGGGFRGTSGTIEITGGDVTAKGYGSAPGIGGQRGDDTDTITIRGGTVTATSVVDKYGNNGAAIGGATSSDAIPDIAIYGGTVTATGGANAAGIGGGRYGDGGKVTVTGGSVYAVGGSGAEAIGHGAGGSSSGTLTNGSESVRLVKIWFRSNSEIFVESIDAPEDYGLTDVETIDKELYLYLPESALPRVITAEDGTQYMGMASFDGTATFVAHTHNTNTTYYETTDAQHTLVTACNGCPIGYMVKAEAEAHSIAYSVSGNVLTAVCGVCGYTETLTLNAPETSAYDKTAKTASVDGAITGATVSDITYCNDSGCINAGKHTASVTVTVGEETWMVTSEFEISPITLTVTGAEAYGRDYDGTDLIDIDAVLLEGILDGDYVSVDTSALTAKLPSANAGEHDSVNLSGVVLVGDDAANYVIESTAEGVGFKDYYGYDSSITVYPLYIYITAEDQTVALNGEIDQTKYALDEYSSLIDGHKLSSVKLSGDTSVSTDFGSVTASDAVIVDGNGNDVTANYEINYTGGRLTVTCPDHDEFVNGFCTSCGGYQPAVLKDNGTPDEDWDDYYEISNAGQLYWFAQYVNNVKSSVDAKLTDNIDVNPGYVFNRDGGYSGGDSPRVWVPIGTSADGGYLVYTGNFDGNGHTISGLYINNPEQRYIGLFGRIGYNYPITDVHIINSYFCGNQYVGAIAGYAEISLSLSSAASDVTVKGDLYVGGLIGNAQGDIVNCFSLATVYSENGGGLVGYSYASIRNCFTTARNVADSVNSSYGGSCSNVYYLGDVDDGFDGTTAVTVEQLASGEIAYLLQAGVEPVDIYDEDWNYVETVTPEIWGQTINTDAYPNFDGAKVYQNQIGGCCEANYVYGYANTAEEPVITHVHDAVSGICICGDYQEPALVDGYYQIANAGNLYWFAKEVNSGNISIKGKLTADIVLPDVAEGATSNWTPIGNTSNPFGGEFDGQGHTVANIRIDTTDDYQGLFGCVYLGTIQNVGVIDSSIKGGNHVGGVCGFNSGTIKNCYNTGSVSGSMYVGGVCGYNSGTIKNCYNTGAVSGNYSGGVCSYNIGEITNCYNTGNVSGAGTYSGGVCGYNGGTTVNCCYLEGTADAGVGSGTAAGTVMTAEQFASGEVAYLLNNGVTDGTQVWYQTVGEGLPTFDSEAGTVYQGSLCNGDNIYANEPVGTGLHNYVNGICSLCGGYEPALPNADGVYEISNAGQLYWFAQQVNSGNISIKSKLTANIVLPDVAEGAASNWTPIGNNSNRFDGEFDGQGHTVANIRIDTTDDYQGLFGYIRMGTIQNVGVIDSSIKGGSAVGGVCGSSPSYGTIRNCYNTGTVEGYMYVGGVCGQNSNTIQNCYNTGNVYGHYAGGVCGHNRGTTVNCYYLEGTADAGVGSGTAAGTVMTAGQFASGEVAYLLNNGVTDGTQVWYQTVGEGLPAFDSEAGTVYQGSFCNGVNIYDNKPFEAVLHDYVNGICSLCGGYEPALPNADGVYEISNAGQLYWFAQQVNSGSYNIKGKLTADIVLPDVAEGATSNWTPIGKSDYPFDSEFDGQNHTVANIQINTTDAYQGLFGYVYEGTIKNVGVIDSSINGDDYVGGVCGIAQPGGTIKNCYNTGNVSGSHAVGGVCGAIGQESTIENCYNTGTVSGTTSSPYYIGGVCGNNYYGTITNCYNTGSVSNGIFVGGVCGINNGTLENCYNRSTVSGTQNVGGVCGGKSGSGTFANCYYLEGTANAGVGTGTADGVSVMTAEQFASGEVCHAVGYHSIVNEDCSLCHNPEDHIHRYVGGVCADCGDLNAVVLGSSLTLEGKIGVHFYYQLDEALLARDDTFVSFTVADIKSGEPRTEKIPLSDGVLQEVNGETTYVFICDVYAVQMTDVITAQLIVGDYESDPIEHSVKDYADKLLGDTTGTYDNAKDLVQSMLTYGAYTQLYAEHEGELADSTASADTKMDETLTEADKAVIMEHGRTATAVEGVGTFAGTSLVLKSETTLKVYVALAEGVTVDDVTFYIGDAVATAEKVGSYYVLSVENIGAAALDTLYSFKVVRNETGAELAFDASTLSYAYNVLSAETNEDTLYTQALKNVLVALYRYNVAANDYAGS